MKRRVAGLIAVVLGAMFVLTGCIKYQGDVKISSNDTVSGEYFIGFDLSALEGLTSMFGEGTSTADPREEFKKQFGAVPQEDIPEGFSVEYAERDDKYIGALIKMDDVSLEEYNKFATEGTQAAAAQAGGENVGLPTIERTDEGFTEDVFIVRWDPGLDAETTEEETLPGLDQLFSDLQPVVDITITFPGDVIAVTGMTEPLEDGANTVKWSTEGAKNGPFLEAIGRTTPDSSVTLSTALIAGVVGLIVLGALAMIGWRLLGGKKQDAAEGEAVESVEDQTVSEDAPPVVEDQTPTEVLGQPETGESEKE